MEKKFVYNNLIFYFIISFNMEKKKKLRFTIILKQNQVLKVLCKLK
jgi:hypothetical protein